MALGIREMVAPSNTIYLLPQFPKPFNLVIKTPTKYSENLKLVYLDKEYV